MLRALSHPPFRLLWSAALTIQVGYWFVTVAFQWVLPHSTDDDAVVLGALYFVTFVPFLLFALPAGALADRRDRRRVLLASQLLAAVVALLSVILAAADLLSAPVVLILGFLNGCVTILVQPANQALTANTVPATDLVGAISLQSIAINLARVGGPMLAGAFLLVAGATGAFAVYAVVCLVAIALISRISVGNEPRDDSGEPMLTRIRAGLAHARDRAPSVGALVLVGSAAVFGCGYQAQLAILGARVSRDGDRAFLVLVICGGVGAIAGVVWVARSRAVPPLTAAALGLVALGGTVAAMGFTSSYAVMVVLCTAGGALTFWVMTCANTLIQYVVDDDQRGRVMSLYFLCWGGLLPFGGIGIGAAIGWFGAPPAFASFGLMAAVAGASIAWRHRRASLPTSSPITGHVTPGTDGRAAVGRRIARRHPGSDSDHRGGEAR